MINIDKIIIKRDENNIILENININKINSIFIHILYPPYYIPSLKEFILE